MKKTAPIVGAAALAFLPMILNIELDALGNFLYVVVLFMTMCLGNAFRFYDRIAWWDTLCHFLAGIVLFSFGMAVLNKPFLSFVFAVAMQTFWEIFEYVGDCIFHTNNQRWQTNGRISESNIQDAGLRDTMNDTIVCVIGALLACAGWWFVLLY